MLSFYSFDDFLLVLSLKRIPPEKSLKKDNFLENEMAEA